MKTQPSHGLFCPHPCPRPRLPFPQLRPTRRYLSGLRPEAAPARNRDAGVGWSIPGSRSSGMDPEAGFRSQWGRFGPVRPSTGPQEVSKVPEVGIEASKTKTEKLPPSLSPGSLPPSGQGAPGNLPSKRPPYTYTHKHTHTVRRSLAWRGLGGGRGLGEEGASFPFRPEVVLMRNSSHTNGRSRNSHREGFQDTQVDKCRREADASPEKNWVGLR